MAITIGMVASNQQLHLRNQTVKETLHQRQWVRDISGALTAPVLIEYSLCVGIKHVVAFKIYTKSLTF